MADAVGKDDVVAAGVEWLPGAEKLSGELGLQELRSVKAGSMADEHGVAHDALGVALRLAQSAVMDFKFRQRFARGE